jgi:biopolymer transport protein ExbD
VKKSTFQTESRTTVVPIINVSLVVVITLMMMGPFLANEEVEVDLPTARADEVGESEKIEITFTMDREIIVGEDHLQMGDITHYLGSLFEVAPGAMALVKADQNLPYGEVEALIAQVEAANPPRIALATKEIEDMEAAQ